MPILNYSLGAMANADVNTPKYSSGVKPARSWSYDSRILKTNPHDNLSAEIP
jgi:hypothetical protein